MIGGTGRPERAIHVDDDRQLVMQARSDTAAFVQLYRRHYDAVFRYCVHRLFDRQTAEDITSEVFLKVVQSFARFDGENEQQFRSWLYRIATNAVNNHLRKTARRSGLLQCLSERTVHQTVDCQRPTERKLELLTEAVFALKPRYQTIIALRFFENLKPIEIADVLGSNPGTIRSQLARALARLRKKMKKLATEVTDESERFN